MRGGLYEEALALFAETLDPGQPFVLSTLVERSQLVAAEGAPEPAADEMAALLESGYFWTDDGAYAGFLANAATGLARKDAGDGARAIEALEAASAKRAGMTISPVDLLPSLLALAELGFDAGEVEAARALAVEAAEIMDSLGIGSIAVRGEADRLLVALDWAAGAQEVALSRGPVELEARVVPLETVQTRRAPGEAMWLHATFPERSVIAWVTRDALQLAAVPGGIEALKDKVDRLRFALDADQGGGRTYPVDLAAELFDDVFGPVAGQFPQVGRIVVIPDGPAQELPLAPLVLPLDGEGTGYLGLEKAILRTPSVHTWTLLGRTPDADRRRRPRLRRFRGRGARRRWRTSHTRPRKRRAVTSQPQTGRNSRPVASPA